MKSVLVVLSLFAFNVYADSKGGVKMPPCSLSRMSLISVADIHAGTYEVQNSLGDTSNLHLATDGTGSEEIATFDEESGEGFTLSALAWSINEKGQLVTQKYLLQDKSQRFLGPMANTASSVLKCVRGEMKCMVIQVNTYEVMQRTADKMFVNKTTRSFKPLYEGDVLIVNETTYVSVEILKRK